MTLEPVHRKCCGDTVVRRTRARPPLGNSSAPRPAETFADFRETALPMLLALGPYAYSDPVLLYKVRWTRDYGARSPLISSKLLESAGVEFSQHSK